MSKAGPGFSFLCVYVAPIHLLMCHNKVHTVWEISVRHDYIIVKNVCL